MFSHHIMQIRARESHPALSRSYKQIQACLKTSIKWNYCSLYGIILMSTIKCSKFSHKVKSCLLRSSSRSKSLAENMVSKAWTCTSDTPQFLLENQDCHIYCDRKVLFFRCMCLLICMTQSSNDTIRKCISSISRNENIHIFQSS